MTTEINTETLISAKPRKKKSSKIIEKELEEALQRIELLEACIIGTLPLLQQFQLKTLLKQKYNIKDTNDILKLKTDKNGNKTH